MSADRREQANRLGRVWLSPAVSGCADPSNRQGALIWAAVKDALIWAAVKDALIWAAVKDALIWAAARGALTSTTVRVGMKGAGSLREARRRKDRSRTK